MRPAQVLCWGSGPSSPRAQRERAAPAFSASELGCIAPTRDPEASQPRKDCQVLTGDERGLTPRDGRRAAAG